MERTKTYQLYKPGASDYIDPTPFNDNADINGITAANQFIVDDIFHDVAGIILPVVQTGIAQSRVTIVIFIRILEVRFPLNIIPPRHPDQEGIDSMSYIRSDQNGIDVLVSHTGERIGNVRSVGKRAYL